MNGRDGPVVVIASRRGHLLSMNRAELLELHETISDQAFSVMQFKNNDYADTADALFNLRQCEALGLCSMEQGILIRITDKLARLSNVTAGKSLAVKDEGVRDTIVDLVNYAVLLAAAIEERTRKETHGRRHEARS